MGNGISNQLWGTKKIFYCAKCNITYSGIAGKQKYRCNECSNLIIETTESADAWRKYTAEEKALKKAEFAQLSQLISEPAMTWSQSVNTGTQSMNSGAQSMAQLFQTMIPQKQTPSNQPQQEVKQSDTAEDLKIYKELLDMGAISIDEYEQKKKQILDLH